VKGICHVLCCAVYDDLTMGVVLSLYDSLALFSSVLGQSMLTLRSTTSIKAESSALPTRLS